MDSSLSGRSRGRPAGFVVLALAFLAFGSGCSGGTAAPAGRTVAVTILDFKLVASSHAVPAGSIRLTMQNRGPSTHELVVVRSDRPADSLPLLPDGLTVDEEASSIRVVDEDSDIPLGTTAVLGLRLAPGRYVLFCNLSGHYLGGMHLSLVAT
jgi:hypothetical protein